MLAVQSQNSPDIGAALIAEFQTALARVTSEKRARMLSALADLFIAISSRVGASEIALFDELLLKQCDITDHETLVALSVKFSSLAVAPPKTIHKLAGDAAVSIAGPVLSHSPQLSTAELVRLAAVHGQDHLHALCGRAEIPPQLSAALLARGGQSVIDRLAVTPGARFYGADFLRLLKRASRDERGRVRVHQRAAMMNNLGFPLTECWIVDISPTGARLTPDLDIDLPNTLALILTAVEGRQADCRVTWKTEAGIGVAFETDPFGPVRRR